jgi:hypothetical protein
MTAIYAIFACSHLNKGVPVPEAGFTRCVEGKAFFQLQQCDKSLGASREVIRNQYARSWTECRALQVDSWLPSDENNELVRLYKAEALVSDKKALVALLAPLKPEVGRLIQPNKPFGGTFEGPGNLTFFVQGDGKKAIVFAVTNLTGPQVRSLGGAAAAVDMLKDNLDFEIAAENIGIKFDYHLEITEGR